MKAVIKAHCSELPNHKALSQKYPKSSFHGIHLADKYQKFKELKDYAMFYNIQKKKSFKKKIDSQV